MIKSVEQITNMIDRYIPEKFRKFSESFFMFIICVYFAFISLEVTTLEIRCPFNMYTLMLLLLGIGVLLQWITHIKDIKRVLIGVVILILYGLVYIFNRNGNENYGHIVRLGLMTAGYIGIDYKKILKLWTKIVVLALLVIFFLASVGAIENLVYYSGGLRLKLRGSLGIVFTTDCASLVLFLVMGLWMSYKKISNGLILILSAASLAIIKLYCDGKCSTLCMALFMLAVIYNSFEDKFFPRLKKIVNIIVLALPSMMVGLMLFFMDQYKKGTSVGIKADKILDVRVSLGARALKEYGIRLFGTNFEMVGAGGNLVSSSTKYNFLDSSYINVLIRYGLVMLVVLLITWFVVMKKAININDRRVLMVMAVIAVHSFEEHHWLDVFYNPLIAMVLADFTPVEDFDKEKITFIKKRVGMLAGLAATVIISVILPHYFVLIRTFVDIKNNSKFWSVLTAIISVASIILIIYGIYRLVDSHVKKTKKNLTCLIAGLVVWTVWSMFTLISVRMNYADYSEKIEADRKAVELIMANHTEKVFSNEFPLYYKEIYGGFTDSYFSGEDMARYHRATVLVDKNTESNCFINRGYLYAQISDYTGVYTNDEAVMKALNDAGYHVTGYYSSAKNVVVDETGQSSEKLSVFRGRYQANAEIEIVRKGKDSVKIGELRVDAYEDSNAVGVEEIKASDFKDDTANISVIFNLNLGSPDTVISVKGNGGYEFRIKSLDYTQKPMVDTHKHYNEKYQVIRAEYFDTDGNRITSGSGESAVEYEYDVHRNTSVIRYYGIDDKPIQISSGYAEIHRTFDSYNHVTSESYFGIDGKPVALNSGQASDVRELDARGNILKAVYYGVDGNKCMLTSGYAEVHRAYDLKGRMISEAYYNTDENPVMLSGGYAALERVLDEDGHILKESYFGKDGNLCLNTSGYAIVEREYDENSNAIVQRTFGTDEKLCLSTAGYAEIHRTFDELSRVTDESYYNTDGEPMVITSGYASFKREYDSMGRITKESYYGTDGNLMALSSGQASEARAYDSNNNCIKQIYYGTDDNPVIINSGFAEIHREFNAKNQLVRETYYGTDGNILTLLSGYASLTKIYDDAGNVIEQGYLDKDGNLVMNTSGYAVLRREYNSSRQIIKESYFDTSDSSVALTSGQASDEREYDTDGNMTIQRFYDTEGQRVEITSGYAELRRVYDSKKRITKESYFGEDGKPIALGSGQASEERTYDEYDNLIDVKYYGTDGKPVITTSGYAELKRKFNDKRQQVAESYYGTDGEPISNSVGIASDTREIDNVGNAIVQKYYDVSGNLALRTDGYAEIHREFNDKRQVTAVSFYGTDGNLIALPTGQASEKYELDAKGNITDIKYYNTSGNQVLRTDGFAEIKKYYNANSKLIREEFYDNEGNLADRTDGYAKREIEYDANGNQTGEKRYKKSGELLQ